MLLLPVVTVVNFNTDTNLLMLVELAIAILFFILYNYNFWLIKGATLCLSFIKPFNQNTHTQMITYTVIV